MYLLNVDETSYLLTEEQHERLKVECSKFDKLYDEMLIKSKEIAIRNEYLVERHPSYWGKVYLRWAKELDDICSHSTKNKLYLYGGCNEHMEYSKGSNLIDQKIHKIPKAEAEVLRKYHKVEQSTEDIFEQFEDLFIQFNEFMNDDIEEFVKDKLEVSDRHLQMLALDWVISLSSKYSNAVMNGTEDELEPYITQKDVKIAEMIDKWHNIDHEFWNPNFMDFNKYIIKEIDDKID